ncbi:MAG: Abi family protein [Blautia wexlerae]
MRLEVRRIQKFSLNYMIFDVQLRLLLFKYCKKAEVRFKSAIANAVSLKTGDAGFYLDRQYYTPTKSEKDKKTRNRNITFLIRNFLPI